MSTSSAAAADLRGEVEGREWYHTLELAPGVVTPGWFDTREAPARAGFPVSLAGRRCLDVGTFDGFWAFEMERRGAAEVHAVDVLDPREWDWPALSPPHVVEALAARKRGGEGFELAQRALGSRVERHERSVYDVTEAALGRFDFIFLGSLLLHLRDPVLALERLRAVCDGELLILDVFDPWLTARHPRRAVATLEGRDRPWWWQSNLAGLVRIVEAAGFERLGRPRLVRMPAGAGHSGRGLTSGALRHRAQRRELLTARFGDPHAAIRARPRSLR